MAYEEWSTMVMIKKANPNILKQWDRSLGFGSSTFFFVITLNGIYHTRKCLNGTFCGKDCEDKRVFKRTDKWVKENRDRICKHCLIYLDAALVEINLEDNV